MIPRPAVEQHPAPGGPAPATARRADPHDRHRPPLLARIAESVYWVGRYLERAESLARAVAVHVGTHLDLPVGADVGWAPLLAVCGVEVLFAERHSLLMGGLPPVPAQGPDELDVLSFVLFDSGNPSSVLSALAAVRSNAQAARAVLPPEAWKASTLLWRLASQGRDAVATRELRSRWLRALLSACSHLGDCLQRGDMHGQADDFIRVGRLVERVDMTARILAARAPSLVPASGTAPYAAVHHGAVLRTLVADAAHLRLGTPTAGPAIIRLALQDPEFARSVATSLAEAQRAVLTWPRNAAASAALSDAMVIVASASPAGPSVGDLRATATLVQHAACQIHASVVASYFAAEPAPAHGPDPDRRPIPGSTPAPGGKPAEAAKPVCATRPEHAGAFHHRTTADDGTMAYRVVHRTVYHYDPAPTGSTNEAHLRPRDTPTQTVITHRLDIAPAPISCRSELDRFGNHVQHFTVDRRSRTLSVVATSDVHVRPVPAPSQTPPWETVRMVLAADRQPTAHGVRAFMARSALVPIDNALARFAAPSFPPRRPVLAGVVDLAARIHHELCYEPGSTSPSTPVLDVLAQRRGVCQDFAQLAIGCLRSFGLAARYVSGYIRSAPAAGVEPLGAQASHAWFAFHLPGWGWIDIDPTNDQVVTSSHVTTAWGRDFADVSPLRGTVHGDSRTERLEVAVQVVPIPVTRSDPGGTGRHPGGSPLPMP